MFDYVKRAEAAGLSWPLPSEMDDRELERRLFVSAAPPERSRHLPEWAYLI